jgi:hypothetical protein
MSATVVQFPRRRQLAIVLQREEPWGAWLVLRGHHGWLFGSRLEALVEARELAEQDAVSVVQVSV